jgi:hemoglobin
MTRKTLLGIAAAAFLTACASSQPSLYQRLGGTPGIAALTDDFINTARADPAVAPRFAAADAAQTKQRLTELLCDASGGPCKYNSRGTAQLSDAEFNALTADMSKTLEKFKLPAGERREVINLMAARRGDLAAR